MTEINIIVPVYGVEPYLSRCIDSILNQTFPNYSLILVDDGSPDRCGTICDEYAAKDNRIVVIHQENKGTSAARNAGIEWALNESNGEWITFVDSDDWVHEDYLKVLYESAAACQTECSAVGFIETTSACVPDIKSEELITPVLLSPDEFFGRVYKTDKAYISVNGPWCKLFKKEIFENIRFPVGKKFEDRFTMYRLVFRCRAVAVSPQPLYYYYLRENSATRIPWAPGEMDDIEATRLQLDFFEKHGARRSRLVAVRDYYRISLRQLGRIRDLNNARYRHHEKAVRKELVRSLVKYRFVLNLSPEEKRQTIFALYPGLKRIVKKVERFIK